MSNFYWGEDKVISLYNLLWPSMTFYNLLRPLQPWRGVLDIDTSSRQTNFIIKLFSSYRDGLSPCLCNVSSDWSIKFGSANQSRRDKTNNCLNLSTLDNRVLMLPSLINFTKCRIIIAREHHDREWIKNFSWRQLTGSLVWFGFMLRYHSDPWGF